MRHLKSQLDFVVQQKEYLEQECEEWKEEKDQIKKYLDGDCSAHKCDLKIIRELQQKLQAKEQECKKLKFTIKHTGLLDLMNKNVELKQALDEIEKYFKTKDTSKTSLFNIFVIEQEILDIINKAKEG